MGQKLCKAPTFGYTDEEIPECNEVKEVEGDVHVLICGIDYSCDHWSWAGPPPNGHGPLDTKFAFQMMIDLAQKSGVSPDHLRALWNQQCTKEGIEAAIQEVGSNMVDGDSFVFYYTGHGDQLPNDDDPNRWEDFDQCLCTVDANGNTDDPTMQYRQQVWMRDDDVSRSIIEATPENSTCYVLCDCCHSGSIMDFTADSAWAQRHRCAVSISGCEDTQTSAGTGKGGMFTRSLTKAIQGLQQDKGIGEPMMVSEVHNLTLQWYEQDKMAGHTQNISIHGCVKKPEELTWPLVPQVQYMSQANTMYRGM